MTTANHAAEALETMRTLMSELSRQARMPDPVMDRVHALTAAVEQARLNYSVLSQRQGYQYMTHNTQPVTYYASGSEAP
jgi:hypothetical protein